MRWLLCGKGKLCSTTLQVCHKAEEITYCGSSSGLTKPSLRFAHGTPWGQMKQAWSSLEQSHNWPASPWLLAIIYSEPRPFMSSRCPRWKSKFPRNGDPLTFSHMGYKWLMFPKNRGVSNNRCSSSLTSSMKWRDHSFLHGEEQWRYLPYFHSLVKFQHNFSLPFSVFGIFFHTLSCAFLHMLSHPIMPPSF